jgi:amino-acid N-acetyltransferase
MIRKATLQDVHDIHRLVEHYAVQDLMLHRSVDEIVETIRDFSVAEQEGNVAGCTALHVYGPDLAEVKSLAVDEARLGQGWGAKLVRACLDEAAALGIQRVFALTYRTPFFEKLGFKLIDKQEMPEKIWSDCVYCHKFDDCDEICVAIDVTTSVKSPLLPVIR